MNTSARMSAVRHFDTPPEMKLRRALWHKGLRFRTHLRGVPGRPDIGLKGRRVAVFVDGCFWHGCPVCYVAPRANAEFWSKKVEYNRTRRRQVRSQLRGSGWTVVEVWGHEVERDLPRTVSRIAHIFGKTRGRDIAG